MAKTFEEANKEPSWRICGAFGIQSHEDLCLDCARVAECNAWPIFRHDYPNESMTKCSFYKEEEV